MITLCITVLTLGSLVCSGHNTFNLVSFFVFFGFQFEAQTSFGSIYKTRIEGNSMFCDYYNIQQKVYCKRLKVLCPEHTKEPKVINNNI
jgi:hypothetical protein